MGFNGNVEVIEFQRKCRGGVHQCRNHWMALGFYSRIKATVLSRPNIFNLGGSLN